MIRLKGIRKRYPGSEVDVLRGVDLTIKRHDFVSLVGRSGSGKTTLLNIIGGLDRTFDGTVEVGGTKLECLDEAEISTYRNRKVGFVFQAYHLLDHLNCRENVALAALFSRDGSRTRTGSGWVRLRADEILEAVGMSGFGGRRPVTLSGGERQRVAVARALFQGAEILLCDEPTGNLDLETGQEVIDLLRGLHQREEVTVIAATHDEAISTAGGRVLSLIDGEVIEVTGGAE